MTTIKKFKQFLKETGGKFHIEYNEFDTQHNAEMWHQCEQELQQQSELEEKI